MSLNKEKKKLNKLIQQSDSEESEHELSYYVNDRIKLMKEVLKTIKPKKIKMMAPSCMRNTDIEEINSMLLEELLGISNKRLKYIFNGQNLDEDSSSSSSEDKPIDVISLDEISDDDLVINVDDDEGSHSRKRKKKESKHRTCKKEKIRNSVKNEKEKDIKTSEGQESVASSKNLMSVLELLELQARARAIKSQLLLENAKTQESISMSKIPTLEEKVGSDDEVIIKTAKTEEIIITSSESEDEDLKDKDGRIGNVVNDSKVDDVPLQSVVNNEVDPKITDTETSKINENNQELAKIKIIENKELSSGDVRIENDLKHNINQKADDEMNEQSMKIFRINKNDEHNEKPTDNDEIIQINLSDDEIDEMK